MHLPRPLAPALRRAPARIPVWALVSSLLALTLLAAALVTVGAPEPARAAAARSAEDCLDRPSSRTTVTGDTTRSAPLREPDLPDGHTLDLRGTVFLGNQDTASAPVNTKPVNVGGDSEPTDLCLVGGYVKGTHSRSLDWEYLKHDPGGGDQPAVRIGGTGATVVHGLRVDNMMNGVRPVSEGLEIHNAYFSYIRDDCLANDDLRSVRIVDSLFDGCYVAFSQRPGRASVVDPNGPKDTSVLELDRVLVRMRRMPGGFKIYDPEPGVETYGNIWKWSSVSGPAIIRDSIILTEDLGTDDTNDLDWPRNVTARNVTVVWTGKGPYPGRLPDSGVTVTTDVRVWERARADWLARHGCTSVDDCDPDRLVNPSGSGATAPTAPDGSSGGTAPGDGAAFSDIRGSAHAAAIERIAGAGITRGCGGGAFCPDEPVTRGQMATFLTRTFGLAPGADPGFSDVADDQAHAASIAAAVDAGIVAGYPDGSYRPGNATTREQMAAMLQGGLDLDPRSGLRFADTANSPHRGAINALSAADITRGCADGLYCPAGEVSRGQMATFLDRVLTYLGR